jgi:putative acetyltransferase
MSEVAVDARQLAVSISIVLEAPHQDDVLGLLAKSDAYSKALYPPESNHLIDTNALAQPNVRFYVARLSGEAVGCGALVLGLDGQAELKRMFVDQRARGRGIGRLLLETLEATALREDVRLIQLETGVSNDEALTLYRRSGYRERGPFGSYWADPLSIFMEKELRV